jgi:hypothetical protein
LPSEVIDDFSTAYSIPIPIQAPPRPPRAIGYPSRISPKANTLIGPGKYGRSSSSPLPSRLSSPTLGKPKPDSVKTASEPMRQARGNFASNTASSESKTTMKITTRPGHSRKPSRLSEAARRGRTASSHLTEKLNVKAGSNRQSQVCARTQTTFPEGSPCADTRSTIKEPRCLRQD